MKYSLRILAVLLMIALLLPACAQSKTNEPAATTPAVDTTAPVTDAPEETTDPNDRSGVKDAIPDGLTFTGETVRILYRGDGAGEEPIEVYDIVGTDNVGDQLTDSIWDRNRKVEERLEIKLEPIPGARAHGEITAMIRQVVMAASDEYDFINSSGNTTIQQGITPYLQDLSGLPYADFSEPWWWGNAIRGLSLDGKTYNYLFGDMNQRNFTQTGAVFYNKSLYANVYGDPDELYSFVLNGTWTIEKMREVIAGAYSDANGDGTENEGDVFGMLSFPTPSTQIEHFVVGCDIELYHYTDDNLIIEFDQERAVQSIDKLIALFHETTGIHFANTDIDNGGPLFANGSYLFYPSRLGRVLGADFREMEDPFGILPYPKLDEDQKEYKSLAHNSGTTVCVPKTVPAAKMNVIGATLEALNAETYRSVMPIFIETALKLKYSRDAMSGQVIDILIGSVTKSPMNEYTSYTNEIFTNCLMNPVKNGKNNFASVYAKVLSSAQKTWDRSVESLNK